MADVPLATISDCNTIFLDAGGVLVWPNWARIAEVLQDHGIHTQPEQLAAADPHIRRSFDAGEVVFAPLDLQIGWKYFDLILSRVGISPSQATAAAMSLLWGYHQTENLWEYVPDFVWPALLELRKLGLQLVVVSNANGTITKCFERLGLAQMVDVIIDSAEVGLEKPDPRLFDFALRRSGASRTTTIHVGDLYRIDVLGARAAGLVGVLVDEANLYGGADCPRVRTIAELPLLIRRGGSK